jgi:hypothetical protein
VGTAAGNLNDLWKWDGTNWTWLGGLNTTDSWGSYGVKGIETAGHYSSGIINSIAWIDEYGNFYFFGGNGRDSVGNAGPLQSLWRIRMKEYTGIPFLSTMSINNAATYSTSTTVTVSYNYTGPATGLCIQTSNTSAGCSWQALSGTGTQAYTLGAGDGTDSLYTFLQDASGDVSSSLSATIILDTTNPTVPSTITPTSDTYTYSTNYTPTWTDGTDANLSKHIMKACTINDCTTGCLTSIDPATSASSSATSLVLGNAYYMCVQALDFAGRTSAWASSAGKITITTAPRLSYAATWLSGSNTINQLGTYGAKGVASSTGTPGARRFSISWIDSSQNLYLFGGYGHDTLSLGRQNDSGI